jgi:hypothetical protein
MGNSHKGGIIDGPRHSSGGVDGVIDGLNKTINMEGGEIVIMREASKKHCKALSEINVDEGGDEIPCEKYDEIDDRVNKYEKGGKVSQCDSCKNCELQKEMEEHKDTFNKVKSGEIETLEEFGKSIVEDHKEEGKEEFLWGGKIKDNPLKINTIDYKANYSDAKLYDTYKNLTLPDGSLLPIELMYVVSFESLYAKYKGLGDIRVFFVDCGDNVPSAEMVGISAGIKDFSKIKITLKLNFKYYEKYKKFKYSLGCEESQFSREAILLHEIQHVLAAFHNGPIGTSKDKARTQALQRINKIRDIKNVKDEEIDDIAYIIYLNDEGELLARKAVKEWLKTKDIDYIDPLDNISQDFEDGGIVDSSLFDLTVYYVDINTESDFKNVYYGVNESEAKDIFKFLDRNDIPDFMKNKVSASISKREDVYEWIGNYDIEDYPIEEYWNDDKYYINVKEGEREDIDHKPIETYSESKEEQTKEAYDSLLDNVTSYIKGLSDTWKYGAYLGSTFYSLIPYLDGFIQVRITDHFFNMSNIRLGKNVIWDSVEGNPDMTNRKNIYGFLSINIIDDNSDYNQDKRGYLSEYKHRKKDSEYPNLIKYITYDVSKNEGEDYGQDIEDALEDIKYQINEVEFNEDDVIEYEKGGMVSEFEMPDSEVLRYGKKLKKDYPEVWDSGGNISGNESFEKLLKISSRGYWLKSEKDFYGRWQSFKARHQHNHRLAGIVANIKWASWGNIGKEKAKEVIEESRKFNEDKDSFMYGGVVGYYDNNFSDKEYKIIDIDKIYQEVYNRGIYNIELGKVIYHPLLFKKYPEIKKLTINFRPLIDESLDELYFGNTFKNKHVYWQSLIEVNLYQKYYIENGKEKYGKESKYPERGIEAILLHELQHVCQLADGRQTGYGRDEIVEIISQTDVARSGEITTESLYKIATLQYKEQHGEQEAMKTVRLWLEHKGLRYGNESDIIDKFEKGGMVDSKDIILYHGGSSLFESFNKDTFGKGVGWNNEGTGVYLTTELWAAKYFSHISLQKKYLKDINKDPIEAKLGIVYTISIDNSFKILDIDNDKIDRNIIESILPQNITNRYSDNKLSDFKFVVELLEVQKAIIGNENPYEFLALKLGYDGIKHKDRGFQYLEYCPQDLVGPMNTDVYTYVIYNKIDDLKIIEKRDYESEDMRSQKNEEIKEGESSFQTKSGNSSEHMRDPEEEEEKIESQPSDFEKSRQKLDEFFTPDWIAKIMIDLAYKYGYEGKGPVLEPSFGKGVFFDELSTRGVKQQDFTGFEIFEPNFKYTHHKYPFAHLYNTYFEYTFLKEKDFKSIQKFEDIKRPLIKDKFKLIIGNPPYGNHGSPHSYYFDKWMQVRAEGFFLWLCGQVLDKQGVLVMILPSLWMHNGNKYNHQKEQIAKYMDLVDAYRLPNSIFEKTDIATDILVFKHKDR